MVARESKAMYETGYPNMHGNPPRVVIWFSLAIKKYAMQGRGLFVYKESAMLFISTHEQDTVICRQGQ